MIAVNAKEGKEEDSRGGGGGKAIPRSTTGPQKFQGRDACFLKDMSHPERGERGPSLLSP